MRLWFPTCPAAHPGFIPASLSLSSSRDHSELGIQAVDDRVRHNQDGNNDGFQVMPKKTASAIASSSSHGIGPQNRDRNSGWVCLLGGNFILAVFREPPLDLSLVETLTYVPSSRRASSMGIVVYSTVVGPPDRGDQPFTSQDSFYSVSQGLGPQAGNASHPPVEGHGCYWQMLAIALHVLAQTSPESSSSPRA